MERKQALEKYARLAVRNGVNLQKGQELVISAPIECAEFARKVAKEAFEAGAKNVVVHYSDEKLSRIRYDYADVTVFEDFPGWLAESRNLYARRGAAFISIAASDPDIFSGVDPQKIQTNARVSMENLKEYYEKSMSNRVRWCVLSVPTQAWADKVFPGHSPVEAQDKLWNAIFKAVRCDQPDPVQAWQQHNTLLKQKVDYLNQKQFVSLHYRNSLGTDLTVGLPRNHIWSGGAEEDYYGVPFTANMPTEEVFTAPAKYTASGTLVSALPLNHNGSLIDGFSLTFHEGRIVDYTARQGYETLKGIIETDEGTRYLGEVALVPFHSPISDMGLLFYNTLFDENASCHFAVGKAYPSCVQGGEEMDPAQLDEAGINDSMEHVDFMVGTSDLSIIATDAQGNEITLFQNGNWAI